MHKDSISRGWLLSADFKSFYNPTNKKNKKWDDANPNPIGSRRSDTDTVTPLVFSDCHRPVILEHKTDTKKSALPIVQFQFQS